MQNRANGVAGSASGTGSSASSGAACSSASRRSRRFDSLLERHYKCIVIGDVLVGKTSCIVRYALQRWITKYKPTFGGRLKHTRSWGLDKGVLLAHKHS